MTTVQSQAAAINVVSFAAAALLLSGCGKSFTTYHIDGATTEFCVPSSIDVTPWRPGSRNLVKGGFAVNGCWNSDGDECQGSEKIVSMAVLAKASSAGRRLADFSSDAHVRVVAEERGEQAKTLANSILAVPDVVDNGKWFIWRVFDSGQLLVADDDELLATCAPKGGFPGFFCDRTIAGPDYSVTYSFFAGTNLPDSFELLDSSVFVGIANIRCR